MNSKLNLYPTSPIDAATFRQGMAHLAAAVNVITTVGAEGKAGFTASAVCSITDQPATLLVCLNRSASVFSHFKNNQVLCVNTLAQQHAKLSQLFASKTPMSERFTTAQWHRLRTGAPVLKDALVAFDCVITERHSVGSHDILICQVQAMQQGHADQALIYFNRSYCEPVPMSP